MATVAITVVYSTYAYNAIPAGVGGANKTLVAADLSGIDEVVRRYIANQFQSIDSNADRATTVSVAIS